MPSWSTPIAAGTDIHDVALLGMLAAAVNERYLFAFGISPITAPAAADKIFDPTYWSALQNSLFNTIAFGLYIDHRITIEANVDPLLFGYAPAGGTPYQAVWTLPGLRVAAGLAATLYYSWNGTSQTHVAASDNTLFRRQRPREILSAAATHDVQGNAAAAGQKAYLVGNDPLYGIGNVFHASRGIGELYICIASGNWQRSVAGPADPLDNTQAAPNAIAESNINFAGTGFDDDIGSVQPGDTMRAPVFEEVRAITDLLRCVYAESSQYLGAAAVGLLTRNLVPPITTATLWAPAWNDSASATGVDPAAAAAEASAAAGWPADITPVNNTYLPFANYQIAYDGTDYVAYAERADCTPQIVYLAAITQKRRAVWYAYADLISAGSATNNNKGKPVTFDNNGDAVLSGQWHAWFTGADSNAATQNATKLGDGTTLPSVPGALPTAGNQVNAGYSVQDIVAVIIGNIAGGFQYCTVTV